MSKNAFLFFKYGIAKLYLIFPIVRIFQITRNVQSQKFNENGRIPTAGRPLVYINVSHVSKNVWSRTAMENKKVKNLWINLNHPTVNAVINYLVVMN
jgi:hypothetical protein